MDLMFTVGAALRVAVDTAGTARARVSVERVLHRALDEWHAAVFETVDLAVVSLQTLLGSESCRTVWLFAPTKRR